MKTTREKMEITLNNGEIAKKHLWKYIRQIQYSELKGYITPEELEILEAGLEVLRNANIKLDEELTFSDIE